MFSRQARDGILGVSMDTERRVFCAQCRRRSSVDTSPAWWVVEVWWVSPCCAARFETEKKEKESKPSTSAVAVYGAIVLQCMHYSSAQSNDYGYYKAPEMICNRLAYFSETISRIKLFPVSFIHVHSNLNYHDFILSESSFRNWPAINSAQVRNLHDWIRNDWEIWEHWRPVMIIIR